MLGIYAKEEILDFDTPIKHCSDELQLSGAAVPLMVCIASTSLNGTGHSSLAAGFVKQDPPGQHWEYVK